MTPSRSHNLDHTTNHPADPAGTLLALPFSVFVCSIARLMVHMGYQGVTIKKPIHGHGKGRNALGGLDIEALLDTGLGRSRVIAQVKQYDRPVPRAFVDELRGAMVRHGAQQGLLFTSATFSRAAFDAASMGAYSMPIRLIDGPELARLLKAKDVPIRADTSRPELDPRHSPKSERPASQQGAQILGGPRDDARSSAAEGPATTVIVTLSVGSAKNPLSSPQ